ncbi:Bro-N domain-containing protein [Pseudomonas sp. A34-9]|uniref:BRO-N domain-containing protein n=1 Tax=Pseudomonas sp. A34-9 TaxID=3034675 RepID=UPI00240D563E|nr:Bro-N domain-containing protein [Pseudomonas sp. A34-9]
MEETYLKPYLFTRHKLPLHALLIQNQPWFSARDLGRLVHIYLNERMLRKLDPDQYQTRKTLIHHQIENTLLISESGIYALLVYHYCPEYRALREWLTHQVIPTLRDTQAPTTSERPHLSLLSWPDMSLSLLHWNNQPWIRLQDVPHMVTEREQVNRTVVNSWWRKALQLI